MIENLAANQQVFTSTVFLVTGDRTVLVDPGNDFDVVSVIEDRVDELDAVVLTHTHPDHIGNLAAVRDAFDVEVWGFDPEFDGVDHGIADGDTIRMGDHDYTVMHTPGHKNDHVCLYAPATGVLFATGTYLLLRRNLVKMVIGLGLLSNGANLVIFTAGGTDSGIPPLIAKGATVLSSQAADPLPQALVLTSIVITFAVQAFALALVYRTYRATGTEDPTTLADRPSRGTQGVDP
jgi:multisubunit Na+/H+ antiporter MnhC subunit